MTQVKIIFFDIDGTLIDIGAEQMSQKTAEALRRLKERGILLCIATGRPRMTLPHFEGITFDAYLTFNGSYCFDRDGIIFSNPIPHGDAETILRNAARIGRPISIATADRIASNGRDTDLDDYYTLAHLKLEVSEDFDTVAREKIYQMMVGCREEEYDAIMKDAPNARITAWWHRAADIIPADGGKGVAVQKVLEHYHLDRSQALAFGDGNNDIEMLRAVGTGIAMGNGSAQVKAAADGVCGCASEDGIYHYCIEHSLI